MDKIAFLYAVAARSTGISLANALGLLEDAERFLVPPVVFDWSKATLDERADEARKNATVMSFLPDRKIMAIKKIRTISGLGLKEAKDIADRIQPPPPAWRSCCNTRTTDRYHDSACYNYVYPF